MEERSRFPTSRDHAWQDVLATHQPMNFLNPSFFGCRCHWRSADSWEYSDWVEHVLQVVRRNVGSGDTQAALQDEQWRQTLEVHRFTVYIPQGEGCTCHWLSAFEGMPGWSGRQLTWGAIIDWTCHVQQVVASRNEAWLKISKGEGIDQKTRSGERTTESRG